MFAVESEAPAQFQALLLFHRSAQKSLLPIGLQQDPPHSSKLPYVWPSFGSPAKMLQPWLGEPRSLGLHNLKRTGLLRCVLVKVKMAVHVCFPGKVVGVHNSA